MKARISMLLLLAALLCCGAANGWGRKSFKGRIAARRFQDLLEVVSFVPNRELFLFHTDDEKWLKLVYQHFGFSDIVDDVRLGARDISISVRRDSSCDQTVSAFEKEAQPIRIEWDDGTVSLSSEQIFFSESVPRPPDSYRVKCYVLERWKPVNPGKSSKTESKTVDPRTGNLQQ